jgi:hypothetical protein
MNKTTVCLFTAASLLLGGCDNKSKSSSTSSSSGDSPLSAPADYGAALGKAKKSADKTVGVNSLDQAIKTFFAEETRYPKDLDELKSKGVTIPAPPAGMKWDYDPNSGVVKAVPQ